MGLDAVCGPGNMAGSSMLYSPLQPHLLRDALQLIWGFVLWGCPVYGAPSAATSACNSILIVTKEPFS